MNKVENDFSEPFLVSRLPSDERKGCYYYLCKVLGKGEKDILPSLCLILVGAILGVLARYFSGIPENYNVYSYLDANFLGTMVIAFLSGHKKYIWYSPLYTGIGTGFCGSFTTFSSWQEGAGALVGPQATTGKVTPGQLVYLWLQIQVVGIAVNLLGYDFGRNLQVLSPFSDNKNKERSINHKHDDEIPKSCTKTTLNIISVLFGILCAAGLGVLTYFYRTGLLFSLCWGPLGAWSRWRLGKLNSISPRFPIGTFIANVLASSLLALAFIGEIGYVRHGTLSCNILGGFASGYCGSLSTVSTFISELKTMEKKDAWLYGFISVFVAQLMVISLLVGYMLGNPNLYNFENGLSCKSRVQPISPY